MAKNKTNTGIFDVSDLAETAQKQINKINAQPSSMTSEPTKRRTIKRETKSKRVNLLVRPSVYEAVVRKAETEGVSVNELINSFMESIVEK